MEDDGVVPVPSGGDHGQIGLGDATNPLGKECHRAKAVVVGEKHACVCTPALLSTY